MIVYHERFLDHRQDGPRHPERPERLAAIVQRLQREGLWRDVRTPELACWEDLRRIHDEAYLRRLQNFGMGFWDADTFVRPETFEIASLAAGGAILAAEHAWSEADRPALALVRPPGHHATVDQAMGFCHLNNIAIAAARLLAEGKGPLAIVDLDVHHGNGTEAAFYATNQVLFVSLHQYPHYPGTGGLGDLGTGKGKGFNVNIPLPAGSGDATYGAAFDRIVEPVIEQFRPAAILVSLGVDAHYQDPLASMALSSPALVGMVDRLWRMAEKLSQGGARGGRLVCCLEGGYHAEALAEVIAGVAAIGEGPPVEFEYTENLDPDGAGRPAVDRAMKVLKEYWKLES